MKSDINPVSLGTNLVQELQISDFLPYLNKKFLFYKLWGYKPDNFKENPDLEDELEDILNNLKLLSGKYIRPKAAYGIFPCNSGNDTLKVFTPKHANCNNCSGCSLIDNTLPLKTFFFERDELSGKNITDYFLKDIEIKRDFVGFQVVTIGEKAVEYAKKLKAESSFQDYFYWYGYCSALTEALAAFIHKKIRKEMGISDPAENYEDEWKMNYRGRRYSFGYNWCKDMSEQRKVLDLLKSEEIQVFMNEGDEMEPEFSTCAVIVHNPEAEYW